MGFTFEECYRLPVWQRRWFLERLNKELKAANEAQSGASRAAHANAPEARALMGRHRAQTPARLRRFT